ncbi:TetR/AcrR family transcriptional regulator [Sphingomonas sp. Leaf17]|uniref:TetR/AcrR family transcriptional regulator n=1 Tax=Sphingomonas sp. Leaf17 TaxID=1735683 RepID=UPI000A466DAC|nr:TetR/AcrR family transcriptional regulator [Sphingomonas sp. Leaf17]
MKMSDSTEPARRRKTGRPLSFDRDVALERAMLTFWRHGYETTSISDLTAAMGITAPSIYTAFGDKKRLFLEAAARYAGDPQVMADRIAGAATAYDAACAMLTTAAAAFTRDDTPRGCLLASATASGSPASADVQQAIAGIRTAIGRQLTARIERDVTAGLMPVDTDAAAVAGLVIAVIQGMSVLARDGAEPAVIAAIARTALDAWPAP